MDFRPLPWSSTSPFAPSVRETARGGALAGARIVVALAALYAAALLVLFPPWTVDEAFITIRYADNLARHGELSYNVGEPPVEGYTGVALPLILAGAIALGVSPVIAGKVVGALSFAAGALLLFAFLGRISREPLIRAGVLALYLSAPFLVTHALAGLETSLFAAGVLGALYAFYLCMSSPRVEGRGEAAFLAAALFSGLIRPEGAALGGLLVAALLVERYRSRRGSFAGSLARTVALYAAPGGAYFLWRWWYYGQLLPNTFHAKWTESLHGYAVHQLASFSLEYLLLPAAACVVLVVVGIDAIWRDARAGRLFESQSALAVTLCVAAAFALLLLLTYSRASLSGGFSYRYLAPLYVTSLLAIAACLEAGARAMREARDEWPLRDWALRLLLVALACFQGAAHLREARAEIREVERLDSLMRGAFYPVGDYLRESVPPSEWLVMVPDAGAIPYLSGLPTVDFGMINDDFLSVWRTNGIPAERVVDYFFARRPGAVVLNSYAPDRVDSWTGPPGPDPDVIMSDPRFAEYALVGVFGPPGETSVGRLYHFVYLRRDLLTEAPSFALQEARGQIRGVGNLFSSA